METCSVFQAHPWFKDVVWDRLYEMEAAFKPEVNGELDTQNFMKFDEVFPMYLYSSSTQPTCTHLHVYAYLFFFSLISSLI